MLIVCFALLMGVTSCSNDDYFEAFDTREQKELSNAELIENALSKMPPDTRANAPFPVVMVTTQKTVTIDCWAQEDMVIHWGDDSKTPIIKNSNITHTYTDNQPSHGIFLEGTEKGLARLTVYDMGLIYLDVSNNTELLDITCTWNNLNELNLTGCTKLVEISADHNNLSSIDVTQMPHLQRLFLQDNQLTNIDVSNNFDLQVLWIGENKLTELDLIKNTKIKSLDLRSLKLNSINNLPISSTSFANLPQLNDLNIAYTNFTSLDLSSNPLVKGIDISLTAISQLDLSNLQLEWLDADYSQLTNLIYTTNSLLKLGELRILNTPFETLSSNLFPLITSALPNRKDMDQGHLYTNSTALIAPFLSYLSAKNWVVNQ